MFLRVGKGKTFTLSHGILTYFVDLLLETLLNDMKVSSEYSCHRSCLSLVDQGEYLGTSVRQYQLGAAAVTFRLFIGLRNA